MTFPTMNLRRVYLVARRDYIGYVKTWGFWISFFLPIIFGALGVVMATADLSVEPVRYETILDETGQHADGMLNKYNESRNRIAETMLTQLGTLGLTTEDKAELQRIVSENGADAGRAFLDAKIPGQGERLKLPEDKTIFIDPPADTLKALQPFLKGEKMAVYKGKEVKLNGALHVHENDGVRADYWSENINAEKVPSLARRYFNERATNAYLKSGGLSQEGLNKARKGTVSIEAFDPTKAANDEGSQAVTREDRIPLAVAAAMAFALWLTIFAGSYMLLTSMLEEKLNKLMEMMLASVRFSEIMFGKLLGAAGLTLTAMFPYIALGIISVVAMFIVGDPEVVAGLTQAFNAKMIVFFFVYLILGYVFYGCLFIAVGSLAESAQDAQTLTTPIMLILTMCFMVVPIGLKSPDSPIIEFASWFPLSAPFAAIIKLGGDPPLWELALSAFFLFLCCIGVVWLASQVFRYGVLSGSGVKGIKGWFQRTILRRSDA